MDLVYSEEKNCRLWVDNEKQKKDKIKENLI